jgi:hypothetical protein
MKIEPQIKLTPTQNKVIHLLQNGWVLITSSEMPGAIVGTKDAQFRIHGGVFWKLYNLGLIIQNCEKNANCGYELTRLGESIKTKPVKV